MKSDFSRVGVDLKLTQAPFNTVLGDVAPCKPNGPACKWQMINWGGGWTYGINPFPSGDQLFATDAGSNYGGYSNPEADKLISANVRSADPQAIVNFANFLANDVPVLWMPHEVYQLSAISNRLTGAESQSPILSLTPEDWQLTQ
jgi:peptide/nickel transport system substrate-binding protein